MNDHEPDWSGNGMHYLGRFGVNATTQRLRLQPNHFSEGLNDIVDFSKGLCENFTLRGVEAYGCSIGPEGAPPLAQALTTNRRLEHLGLSNCRLATDGVVMIADAIKLNQTLFAVDLSANEATDPAAGAISEALVMSHSITALSLEHNKFHADGYAALAVALGHNVKLKHLNAAWGKAKVQGCAPFGHSLRVNTTLRTLNMMMTELSPDACFVLFYAMLSNTGIESLNVSMNNIGSAIAVLGEVIATSTTLREVNLERSELKKGKEFDAFCRALSRRQGGNLVALNISKNELGNDSMSALCCALQGSSSLRYLDLAENSITTAECVTSIMKLMETCTNFHTLHLDNNNLSSPHISDVMVPALQSTNFCLACLNLTNCHIQEAGIVKIATALTKTNTLQFLSLGGNTATEKTFSAVLMMLKCQSNLVFLDASNVTLTKDHVLRLHDVFVANSALSFIVLRQSCVSHFLPLEQVLTRRQTDAWFREVLDETLTELNGLAPQDNPLTMCAAPPICCAPLGFALEAAKLYLPTSCFSSINIACGTYYTRAYTNVWSAFLTFAGRPLRGWDLFSPTESKASTPTLQKEQSLSQRQKLASYRRTTGVEVAFVETSLNTLPVSDDELRTLFNKVDINGNGVLETDEMKGLLRSFESFGVVVSEKRLKWMVEETVGKGGKVTFDAFCVMMLQLARQ